jgi:hypothetical protein
VRDEPLTSYRRCLRCGRETDASQASCPSCGATLAAKRPLLPLTAGGRAAYAREVTREARIFLVGVGCLLLLVWASACATGAIEGDDRSIFALVFANRHPVGAVGAALLGAGVLFWLTDWIVFAYLGGLVWILVAASPFLCLLRAPSGPPSTTPVVVGTPEHVHVALVWGAVALAPLYRFRELAGHRRRLAEQPARDDGDPR